MSARPNDLPAPLDVARVRADFPLLSRDRATASRSSISTTRIRRRSRARSSRPSTISTGVINANVSRAVHTLGEEATTAYEATRDKLARFINAPSRDEIVFTSGTTQAINLVAYSYLLPRLEPGDEIVVTTMEHHANIVPWQILGDRAGAKLKVAPITEKGELIVEKFIDLLTPRVKLAGVVHVSNVLGTINPVAELARAAREARHSAARRRLAGDAAHAGRRARARLRFLRADRPQDVRPDRHRRAVGAQGTAARHAAVLRRRRDDPRSALRRHDVCRSAASLRSRHAEHRGFRRARRRDRLHRIARPRAHRGLRARACSNTRPPR